MQQNKGSFLFSVLFVLVVSESSISLIRLFDTLTISSSPIN